MRRTTATTAYLKECMGTALLELMAEKPMEKISIEEMTARADVGRSTYFRYFKSKDEVLAYKIYCLWDRYAKERQISEPLEASPDAVLLFFSFCLSIRGINDMLYAGGHQNVILMAYRQIAEVPEADDDGDVQDYYVRNAVIYALYGLVNAWILRGYRETPEEMARIAKTGME